MNSPTAGFSNQGCSHRLEVRDSILGVQNNFLVFYVVLEILPFSVNSVLTVPHILCLSIACLIHGIFLFPYKFKLATLYISETS